MDFQLISKFQPTGDQPQAIEQLTQGVLDGVPAQVLLGVTGSGKTFTMANVIQNVGKPTLIFSHNKTLAHQLYTEMKAFFPNNAVEYYVSYYDYYQPEAYIPSTGTYIEKDLAINEDLDRRRLAATSALLSGRKDVIIVSSVSCIYGMGAPTSYAENILTIQVDQDLPIESLRRKLVDMLYVNNDLASPEELERGQFRVKGETVDVYLAYDEKILRICYFDDTIEDIQELDIHTLYPISSYQEYKIYPANLFMTTKEQTQKAIHDIEEDLHERIAFYEERGDMEKAKQIELRVTNDLEWIRETGHCSGIENYSRYFDGRKAGERPYCLLDFFPDDYLLIVDESHQSIPQVKAMWGGDRHRKENLVDYAFRLPAALDNRPLRLEEFEALTPQTIYVSATPAEYELERAEGVIVEQLIRPTGLLDPPIEVRPKHNFMDDLIEEIHQRNEVGERTLVITSTKRQAEEVSAFFNSVGIKANYIHSDVDTFDRVDIINNFRAGTYDVLIGINLLREGLDIPEVSLVAILDADYQGFLRDHRSLVQIIGRAARNVHGLAIMYAETITETMQRTIDETNRRRKKQMAYNEEHGITPTQIQKAQIAISQHKPVEYIGNAYIEENASLAAESEADTIYNAMTPDELRRAIERNRKLMKESAKHLEFLQAEEYKQEVVRLEELLARVGKLLVVFLVVLFGGTLTARGQWGGEVRFTPGKQLIMDEYSKQWIHGRQVYTVAAELTHVAVLSDSDLFAADYGYPTLSLGVAYDFNHGVTMHRYPSPLWGKAQEVDYMSKLGNALTVYGAFSRPLVRSRHWEAAYVLRMGLGFNALKYNKENDIDNELIGSYATIFFGAGCMISYFITPEWALTAGVEYHHHSNGALYRPNKGENAFGPTVGVKYAPAHKMVLNARRGVTDQNQDHGEMKNDKGYWFADFSAGLGAKAMLEDWQVTQFHTAPDAPDYRTDHFTIYPAFSASASLMRRYARRWASGIGADVFYGTYDRRVREIERQGVLTDGVSKVSPWSVGIAGRHEVYYHRLSLAMSLGVYLYRHMGIQAKKIEKPYYERIGLHYAFPRLNNMYVGVNVNAHLTKADFTELTVGMPLRMK